MTVKTENPIKLSLLLEGHIERAKEIACLLQCIEAAMAYEKSSAECYVGAIRIVIWIIEKQTKELESLLEGDYRTL